MRYSFWKEPKVALTHVADKAAALLIDSCDARVTVQHNRPLRLDMPVQLTDATGGQSHLHARHCLRYRQLPHSDLPGPSTTLDTFARQREGILKRSHGSVVRLRGPHRIRILAFQGWVLRPRIRLVR